MTPDLWEKRICAKEYPGICDIDNHNQPDVVLDVLESGKPYQIHLGYFNSTNIVDGAIAAQPRRWKEALKKLDFMVCSDTFMNPTAMALADVFLPLSTFAAVSYTHLDVYKRQIIEQPGFYPNLSVEKNLECCRIQKGVPGKDAVPKLLDTVGLASVKNLSLIHI